MSLEIIGMLKTNENFYHKDVQLIEKQPINKNDLSNMVIPMPIDKVIDKVTLDKEAPSSDKYTTSF
jgi:hypothetical protein